jgi:hypothetical protein
MTFIKKFLGLIIAVAGLLLAALGGFCMIAWHGQLNSKAWNILPIAAIVLFFFGLGIAKCGQMLSGKKSGGTAKPFEKAYHETQARILSGHGAPSSPPEEKEQ